MIPTEEIPQLIKSFIWLLAGVGVFIVGMNFLSDALEKCAGSGMKKLLGKISNNRFSGVGIGAGVTAIIQSSSATSVMVMGLVNAGAMTLMQATPVIMGANIGTTITGVLVALKNDYFNTIMYLFAFLGVMAGFFKNEKIKLIGSLFCGLGFIFVGLNVMSSEEAFSNPVIVNFFVEIFKRVNFPPLLILIGVIFTALIQSSSASTGVVITMVGAGVLPVDLALFIVLGANIGTCVTALLASIGANQNTKRIAFIHFIFNVIGTILFTALLLTLKTQILNLLTAVFPGSDAMSLQMRISFFHVVFNVTTTIILLPFVKQLVKLSTLVIKDKKATKELSLKYVDDRLLAMPTVALMQVKKEIDYMMSVVRKNLTDSFTAIETGSFEHARDVAENEDLIDFTNGALTDFLIKLSPDLDERDEQTVGSYFHVLNDLERIGDHADNFNEIGVELKRKGLAFSERAVMEITEMKTLVLSMFEIAGDAFENSNKDDLKKLDVLEDKVDKMKDNLTTKHFARLAEGFCKVELSPYYSSTVLGLERVADHLVNVGYSIQSPIGSQNDDDK